MLVVRTIKKGNFSMNMDYSVEKTLLPLRICFSLPLLKGGKPLIFSKMKPKPRIREREKKDQKKPKKFRE